MKTINYSAKVLPDGHLSLPGEIFEKMGLAVNSIVEVTLKKDFKRERAIKAFGAWSDRIEIEDSEKYLSKIRAEWDEHWDVEPTLYIISHVDVKSFV